MVYNTFGFREPRVASLTPVGGLMQLFDGAEMLRAEFTLVQLQDVLVHAVDDTVVSLSFAIGAELVHPPPPSHSRACVFVLTRVCGCVHAVPRCTNHASVQAVALPIHKDYFWHG